MAASVIVPSASRFTGVERIGTDGVHTHWSMGRMATLPIATIGNELVARHRLRRLNDVALDLRPSDCSDWHHHLMVTREPANKHLLAEQVVTSWRIAEYRRQGMMFVLLSYPIAIGGENDVLLKVGIGDSKTKTS